MPTPAAVQDELTDIVVQVLGCDPADVVPEASFKDLGADSLTLVEIGEELGRRFDVHLSDQTIDSLRTVRDGISAVLRHDGETPGPKDAPPVPASATPAVASAGSDDSTDTVPSAAALLGIEDTEVVKERAGRAVRWMGLVGLVVGALLGLGFAFVVGASGIDDVSLPPLPSSTTKATPTETTPTPKPTPTATTSDPTPEPSISAESERVAPGERFVLSGAFPTLDAGEDLQVEVRDPGGEWDDFPITVKSRDGGEFKTELYTSRTGERQFRLRAIESGETTPSVKIRIG